MIINTLLIFCCAYSLFAGVTYIRKKDSIDSTVLCILLMGIGCSVWTLGYGLMGMSPTIEMAPVYRRIGVVGSSLFIFAESYWFVCNAVYSKALRHAVGLIFFIISAYDIKFYGDLGVYTYYQGDGRIYYLSNNSIGELYHLGFLIVMFVIFMASIILWRRRLVFEREKRNFRLVLAATVLTFIGSIPNAMLPKMGIPSIPLAAILSAFTYGTLLRLINLNSECAITSLNIGRYAYDKSKSAFLSFSLEGRLEFANKYARELLSINKADSQRLSELFDLEGNYDKTLFEKIKQSKGTSVNFKTKKSNISCRLDFTVPVDDDGNPYCVICVLLDLSKEEELMEEIRQASIAKSSFLANMSHEIRTPINAILGMNEMILRESTYNNIQGYARNIEKSGNRLLSIVNDILDYSKIESGKMDIIAGEYSIAGIFNDLILEKRLEAQLKGLDFIFEINPEMPERLFGDEVRIKQILSNILSNAIKYTDTGRVEILGDFVKESDDSITLCVCIKDTGRGIREEDRAILFNAFERVDSSVNKSIYGTGLGLAIVGKFVKMMNGNIEVRSKYKKGSEFAISIPQRMVSIRAIGDFEKQYAEFEKHQTIETGENFTAASARLLVVDDNEMNINVVKYLLKRTEIIIDCARSGHEAIDKLRRTNYQVVLLDHLMPGMDGVETLKTIRDEKIAEDVPIIALTANDGAGIREMYLDYGFTDYLAKPVSGKILEAKLLMYLPAEYVHRESNFSNQGANDYELITLSKVSKDDRFFHSQILESKRMGDIDNHSIVHVFIINPIVAGNAYTREIRERLKSYSDLRYFVFTTIGNRSETTLVKKIQAYFQDECIRIYCCGGSGTLRNVLNGIEDFSRVEIAFCPMGLTNDYIKVFGPVQDSFRDIDNLIQGKAERIDYIKTTSGVCINAFSVGLDSNIARKVDENRVFRLFGQSMPYVIAFLYAMFVSTPDEYEITLDDELFEGYFSQIIFGKGKVLGGSFWFTDDSRISDGLANHLLFGNHQGIGLLPMVLALVSGNQKKIEKHAIVGKARKMTIRRKDGGILGMDFDGEMEYGNETWEAEVVEKGLSFVLPKGVKINE